MKVIMVIKLPKTPNQCEQFSVTQVLLTRAVGKQNYVCVVDVYVLHKCNVMPRCKCK